MPRPMLSISQVTTPDWSFEQEVAAYAAAGIEGIGVWRGKLRAFGVARGASLLRSAGLSASSLNPELTLVPDDGSSGQERRDALRRAMDDAATIGAPVLVVLPGPRNGRATERMDALAREALAWAGTEAAARGLRLAVEPIRAPYLDYLTTLRATLDLLDAVPAPALGVLFDTWHLWDEPDLPSLLRRATGRIALAHLSDWREPTRWHDDRLLPGDGCIPLRALMDAVEGAGLDGAWEVEIFSTDIRAGDCRGLPALLRERFDQLRGA